MFSIQKIQKQIIAFIGKSHVVIRALKIYPHVSLLKSASKDGPKEYYTLECLVYLAKNVDQQHPNYIKTANVSVCLFP